MPGQTGKVKTRFVIYKIYWPRHGWFYIGKTKGLRKRRNRHFREMQDGTHHNKNLVKVCQRIGIPKIRVLMYCESDDHLNIAERELLSLYQNHKKNLNISNH